MRGPIAVLVFFQAEVGIRDDLVTGVQTCALPILDRPPLDPPAGQPRGKRERVVVASPASLAARHPPEFGRPDDDRSEERRVGKECRGRGWQGSDKEKAASN